MDRLEALTKVNTADCRTFVVGEGVALGITGYVGRTWVRGYHELTLEVGAAISAV